MNGLPPKYPDKYAPRSSKEGTTQNPMCFLQNPKDSRPFQVDKVAYQESNLRKEEGQIP